MPSKDWLGLVKTSRARNKIKHLINAGERVKAIEIGQKYLEKEARRLGVSLGKVTKSEMERVASEYGYSKMEDLHAALGYGKFSARQVLSKIAPGVVKEEAPELFPPSDPTLRLDDVELGEDTFHELAEEAEGRFADRTALKAFLQTITNPDSRELILGTVLSETLADTLPHEQAQFIEWLAKEWNITIKINDSLA